MTSTSDTQDPAVRARVQAAIDLHREKRFDDAAYAYRQLIADNVAPAIVYSNLASLCVVNGQLSDAADLFAEAVAHDPGLADAHLNLGLCLQKQGKTVDALGPYREAAARSAPDAPVHVRALHRLALALRDLKDSSAEIETWQRLVVLRPDNHQYHMELGLALQAAGRMDEAIAALTKATELEPRNPQAFANLGYVLRHAGRFEETIACFRKAADLRPMNSMAHVNLGIMLSDQARMDEAIASFRRAVELQPDNPTAHSALIFLLAFGQLAPQGEILATSRRFEADACPKAVSPLPPRRIDTGRKVRIAFMSAEIGDHAVAHFLETYLRNYDRNKFEITLYCSKRRSVAEATPLLALADATRELSDTSDEEARRQILGDNVDILIDTTSHTARGRLRLLSQRCAPIQCHYIGFFGTTGVSAIDYFIGDDEVTPPKFAGHFTERLIRLPRLWVAYTPPVDAPAPEAISPPDKITFGCFNNLLKVREETLTIWAAVLKAVPQARLIIKDSKCADPYNRQRVSDFLAKQGVATDRLEFLTKIPSWNDHMRLYNRIDVALDTTPLNSGTTGFDALYMATPLVAMRGNWMGGRMSASMLKALGRAEWIASSVDEYVDIVRRLTTDLPRLKSFKKVLRAEMLTSPLCDGKGLARDLEAAFLAMIADHNAAL